MTSGPGTRRAATLPVAFFQRPADVVARDLIGTHIVSRVRGVVTSGRIVETEAYLGHVDPASHAFANRRHARNQHLYGPAGTWYVYLSYGVHWCANLVCGTSPNEGAVLLRAVEPLDGLAAMRRRRGGVAERLLASGPGRLTQALGITLGLDGQAMRDSNVIVCAGPVEGVEVMSSVRIGITRAVDWPLRFVERGSKWVSR